MRKLNVVDFQAARSGALPRYAIRLHEAEPVMPPGRPALPELLAFAHTLADEAGRAILPFFRQPIAVTNKAGGAGFDPVTAADLAAERAIVAAIRARFPSHGLVGEEYGTGGDQDGPFRWVIDPIDGTRAFIMGSPLWGTLIGLLEGERALLGMMDQPFTGERFWAAGARGAFLRHRGGRAQRLRTRRCPVLQDAVLSTTHPDLFAPGRETEAFLNLKERARMTRYGGDCYAYCLLAAGFIDLVVETGLKPHDVVALVPIIEQAGGRVTTWAGGPALAGGRILAAGDPQLHAHVLQLLRE